MKIQVGTVLELESISYIIREQIDESGNATVWKAEAPGDSHKYAIKVLSEGTSKHNEKLIRFSRECQFCKETYHRHIVKVFHSNQKGKWLDGIRKLSLETRTFKTKKINYKI